MSFFNQFRTLIRLTLLFAIIIFAAVFATAQTPDPFDPGSTSQEVFTWYTGLYSALITVITFLQGAFFKKSTWIPNTAVRYLLIAVVAGALFIGMGWANALGVFVGFVGSAITYDKVLSPLGIKTPKPTI